MPRKMQPTSPGQTRALRSAVGTSLATVCWTGHDGLQHEVETFDRHEASVMARRLRRDGLVPFLGCRTAPRSQAAAPAGALAAMRLVARSGR